MVVFSVLPFAVFLNENRAQAALDLVLALYPLFLLIPGLLVVGLFDRFRGRSSAERAAVVFAASTYVLFHFQFARSVAESLGLSSDLLATVVWLALFVGVTLLAVRLSAYPVAWSYALVAGCLLLALPAGLFAYFKATESAPALSGGAEIAEISPAPGEQPDVYFFLLDGYGRADQLEKVLGDDNAPFLNALRRRGFQVRTTASAAYPLTHLSLASTLTMGYPVTGGDLDDHAPFYEAVGGDNDVVRAFHQLGYRFVLATDYSSFGCGDQVDLCIEPSAEGVDGVGGEREWAILEATPLATVLPSLGIHVRPLSGYLSPEEVLDRLEIEQSEAPLFVYSHLLTPHPPYRYLEGCALREDLTDPELDYWGDAAGAGGEQYGQAVECVNRSLLRSVDRILATDPDAIIVIQGDHGPKFGIDFHRPLSEWSAAQLRQRFPILNAERLPPGCNESGPRAELAVNTFRMILSCISETDFGLLPSRRFMIDLEAGEIERVDDGAPDPEDG